MPVTAGVLIERFFFSSLVYLGSTPKTFIASSITVAAIGAQIAPPPKSTLGSSQIIIIAISGSSLGAMAAKETIYLSFSPAADSPNLVDVPVLPPTL